MNAKLEYKQVQMGMALGMRTVGKLLAYLKAKETSRIIKFQSLLKSGQNPKQHCIKKYNFKQLTGEWI